MKVAQWLMNLIREGLIADGDVDERPIQEVKPDDLSGYTQCHYFAGIGGWRPAPPGGRGRPGGRPGRNFSLGENTHSWKYRAFRLRGVQK